MGEFTKGTWYNPGKFVIYCVNTVEPLTDTPHRWTPLLSGHHDGGHPVMVVSHIQANTSSGLKGVQSWEIQRYFRQVPSI